MRSTYVYINVSKFRNLCLTLTACGDPVAFFISITEAFAKHLCSSLTFTLKIYLNFYKIHRKLAVDSIKKIERCQNEGPKIRIRITPCRPRLSGKSFIISTCIIFLFCSFHDYYLWIIIIWEFIISSESKRVLFNLPQRVWYLARAGQAVCEPLNHSLLTFFFIPFCHFSCWVSLIKFLFSSHKIQIDLAHNLIKTLIWFVWDKLPYLCVITCKW